MVLSREHKQKAYLEAKSILELGKRWQQLVPGERRPNFEKAAAEAEDKAKDTDKNTEAYEGVGGQGSGSADGGAGGGEAEGLGPPVPPGTRW